MDPLNLLEEKELQSPGSVRPVWTVGLGALLLPGLGHLLLGKTRPGVAILAGGLLALGLTAGLLILDVPHAPWVTMRIALLAYLFGLMDSVLTCIELDDGRQETDLIPPRRVAFLNLVSYGGGYWRLEETRLAVIACAVGVPAHLGLGLLGWPAALAGELVVATMALHGLRMAEDRRLPRYIPKIGEERPVVRDTTPAWVVPAFCIHGGLLVVLAIAVLGMGRAWLDASAVDQTTAVSVEPYYRNPVYGLTLEMNAPGWAFTRRAEDDLVVARHVAEDTSARLSVRPRVPWIDSGEKAIAAELERARRAGYQLTLESVARTNIGGLEGLRAHATGNLARQSRSVAIFTSGHGWRQYILWFEWGSKHDGFAQAELDFLLSSLRIEG